MSINDLIVFPASEGLHRALSGEHNEELRSFPVTTKAVYITVAALAVKHGESEVRISQIVRALGLSEGTVKVHLKNLASRRLVSYGDGIWGNEVRITR